MGFFSHRCAISNESIPAYPYAEFPKIESEVMLFLPNGEIIEGVYDGYGKILTDEQMELSPAELSHRDDLNLMTLVPKAMHDIGLIPNEDGNFTLKEILDCVTIIKKDHYDSQGHDDLHSSPSCEYQGYFYPAHFDFNEDARANLVEKGLIPPVIEESIFKCRECGTKYPDSFSSDDDVAICKWCSGDEE